MTLKRRIPGSHSPLYWSLSSQFCLASFWLSFSLSPFIAAGAIGVLRVHTLRGTGYTQRFQGHRRLLQQGTRGLHLSKHTKNLLSVVPRSPSGDNHYNYWESSGEQLQPWVGCSLGSLILGQPRQLLTQPLQVAWLQCGTNCCCVQSNWHSPGTGLTLQARSVTAGSRPSRMLFRPTCSIST